MKDQSNNPLHHERTLFTIVLHLTSDRQTQKNTGFMTAEPSIKCPDRETWA